MAAPVIHTVGTGMSYATISAAIAAAGTVSGDAIEVYAGGVGNVYAEYVDMQTSGKNLQLLGMVPNRGITIQRNAGGGYVVRAETRQCFVSNFVIQGLGANMAGVYTVYSGTLFNCELVGPGTGTGVVGGAYGRIINCIARGWDGGFQCNVGSPGQFWHCTSCHNVSYGFNGNGVGSNTAYGCLAAGNGVNDYRNTNTQWCVSGDASAAGIGCVTGFNTADFVDYAGNDFRISQAARLTTLARLPGYPLVPTDITGRRRPTREHVFFAGAYHCFEQPTWGVGELSGIH